MSSFIALLAIAGLLLEYIKPQNIHQRKTIMLAALFAALGVMQMLVMWKK